MHNGNGNTRNGARDAVIIGALRTPFGKRGGQFSTWHPVEMLSFALKGLMDETSISGQIFNVGSTERVSILELADRVRAQAESQSESVFIPYEEVYGLGIEDTLHREPAIEKIAAAIGWRPSRTLDEVIADVIEHARSAAPSATL